jgi:hypothetical protein
VAHKPTRLESLKSADGGGTFEDMEHRGAFLEQSFEKMDAKLGTLVSDISSLKGDVSFLKRDVSSLTGDVSSLKGDLSALKEDTSYLKGRMEDISYIRAKMEDLSYLKGKVDTLPTTLHLLGFVMAVLATAGLAKYFTP